MNALYRVLQILAYTVLFGGLALIGFLAVRMGYASDPPGALPPISEQPALLESSGSHTLQDSGPQSSNPQRDTFFKNYYESYPPYSSDTLERGDDDVLRNAYQPCCSPCEVQ